MRTPEVTFPSKGSLLLRNKSRPGTNLQLGISIPIISLRRTFGTLPTFFEKSAMLAGHDPFFFKNGFGPPYKVRSTGKSRGFTRSLSKEMQCHKPAWI